MGVYERKDYRPSIPLHSPHIQMISDILSRLSERELELMRRAYKITRPKKAKEGRWKSEDEGALLAHALVVGLTQLSQAVNPDSSYHYTFQGSVVTHLHDAIRSQHKPEALNHSPFTLDQADLLISRFEEMRAQDPDRINCLNYYTPSDEELHSAPSSTTDDGG